MAPILRLLTETGETRDDPSEDAIFEYLTDVDRGDEQYLIIERLSDPSGQTYAQTIKDGGSWIVERRDGSPETHYRAMCSDFQTTHRLLTAWAFDLQGWRDAAWENVRV